MSKEESPRKKEDNKNLGKEALFIVNVQDLPQNLVKSVTDHVEESGVRGYEIDRILGILADSDEQTLAIYNAIQNALELAANTARYDTRFVVLTVRGKSIFHRVAQNGVVTSSTLAVQRETLDDGTVIERQAPLVFFFKSKNLSPQEVIISRNILIEAANKILAAFGAATLPRL